MEQLIDKRICFLGCGNMGEALVSGLVQSGSARPENITCTDVREERLEELRARYGVRTTPSNTQAAAHSEIVVYAVKPQLMAEVLKETSGELDMSKLVISIAAGVPLRAIESLLQKQLRLIRVMPNIAASVKESATAISAGKHAKKEDIELAMAIFNSVGKAVFLRENYLMDAITGLSGSGPAYLFIIVDALADAGVKMGLSRKDAQFLAAQTVLGAAKMLMETGEHPGQLKDRVTSPGGTAIAGIHTLEKGGLRTTLINAVEAATQRSKELGEMMIKYFAESNNH
ncbi:MAG: pyrroline-5-carboxylate reductase [Desulfobacterales bacterium]|nr:pyrroline-5-carboxylate reductase [Desulfobacterales bacterium]